MSFADELRRSQYTVKREVAAAAIESDVGTVTRIMEGTRSLKLDQVEPFAAAYGWQIIPVGFAAIDPAELAAIRVLAEACVLHAEKLPVTPEIQQAMARIAAGMAQKMLKTDCDDASDEVIAALRVLNMSRLQSSLTPANASEALAKNNRRLRCSRRRKGKA
ncbi:hypothetical protein GKO28_17985 [Deefgea sp. CFH1-16]|nr:hypothetical protein [Deefgea sp. CFH1-16]